MMILQGLAYNRCSGNICWIKDQMLSLSITEKNPIREFQIEIYEKKCIVALS